MNIGAIVQASNCSQRFPGKMLRPLGGKPLMQYLLESLRQCESLSEVVVTTSRRSEDDEIQQYCRQFGVNCFRGSLRNVVGRVRDVLLLQDWDGFVRLHADSPLLDYRLVSHAVGITDRVKCDLVTNIFPHSFPQGQSVEMIHREVFLKAYKQMHRREDLLHTTPYFYRHVEEFKIVNFAMKANRNELQLAIDAPEDFLRLETILADMSRPHWEYPLSETLEILGATNIETFGKAA